MIICILLEWSWARVISYNSFLGSAVHPPTPVDHQLCSTPHDQRRHMVFPLALAAALSTRTRLPLRPTTASIHGAPLPLLPHPRAKSHPSSQTPSVRYVTYSKCIPLPAQTADNTFLVHNKTRLGYCCLLYLYSGGYGSGYISAIVWGGRPD